MLGVQAEDDGTQRLVRVSPARAGPNEVARVPRPETRLPMLRDEAAPSFFFETFHWAPFWRPLILSATKDNFPAINKVCFRALASGYSALGLGDETQLVKARRLYGQVLVEVQSLLMQPAKPELAKLGFTMVVMGMYEVSCCGLHGVIKRSGSRC